MATIKVPRKKPMVDPEDGFEDVQGNFTPAIPRKKKVSKVGTRKKPVQYNKLAGYNNGFKDGYNKGVSEGFRLAEQMVKDMRIKMGY